MKVKMKVSMSGTLDGVPWPKIGEVGEVPDSVGAKLVASGQAEAVGSKAKAESVVVEEATADDSDVESRPARTRK